MYGEWKRNRERDDRQALHGRIGEAGVDVKYPPLNRDSYRTTSAQP